MNSSISNSSSLLRRFFIALLGSVILIVFTSEYLVRNFVLEQDSFQFHVELFNSSTSPNIAIGDSHLARGYLPPDDMVNLSYPSEGIKHFRYKIETYFKDKPAGNVILSADPHLFSPYRVANDIQGYAQEFEDFEDGAFVVLNKRYRVQLTAYWASFIANGGNLTSTIKKTKNGTLLSPGNISEDDARYLMFDGRTRINLHSIRTKDIDQLITEYEAMLAFLKQKGANICMVTAPLSSIYLESLEEYATDIAKENRQAVLNQLQMLASRYGATYLDHQRVITDNKYFRDVDHLNGEGAILYSDKLTTECFGH